MFHSLSVFMFYFQYCDALPCTNSMNTEVCCHWKRFCCFFPFCICSIFKCMLYFLSFVNNVPPALFELPMILHSLLLLCICLFAHCMCMAHTQSTVQRDNNCMCCSSWLQYRICHSLSTIQYVLVPQVQRQLQATLLHATGSRSSSKSRCRSGSRPPLQLR